MFRPRSPLSYTHAFDFCDPKWETTYLFMWHLVIVQPSNVWKLFWILSVLFNIFLISLCPPQCKFEKHACGSVGIKRKVLMERARREHLVRQQRPHSSWYEVWNPPQKWKFRIAIKNRTHYVAMKTLWPANNKHL